MLEEEREDIQLVSTEAALKLNMSSTVMQYFGFDWKRCSNTNTAPAWDSSMDTNHHPIFSSAFAFNESDIICILKIN